MSRPDVRWGPPPVRTLSLAVEAAGLFRVADPSIEGYELYRGVGGAEPDFTLSPFDTFTALPHTTAALAADEEHRFVLRYRNRWGILTQNVNSSAVVIDADGEATITPPSDPFSVTATAGAGTVTIEALYRHLQDGDNAADTWLLYLTTDGTDPDVETDTPIESDIRTGDGLAQLEYITAALTEGTVVKAIVRTRRSGTPDADSINTTIVTATATYIGPDAANPADGFYGEADRQA